MHNYYQILLLQINDHNVRLIGNLRLLFDRQGAGVPSDTNTNENVYANTTSLALLRFSSLWGWGTGHGLLTDKWTDGGTDRQAGRLRREDAYKVNLLSIIQVQSQQQQQQQQ